MGARRKVFRPFLATLPLRLRDSMSTATHCASSTGYGPLRPRPLASREHAGGSALRSNSKCSWRSRQTACRLLCAENSLSSPAVAHCSKPRLLTAPVPAPEESCKRSGKGEVMRCGRPSDTNRGGAGRPRDQCEGTCNNGMGHKLLKQYWPAPAHNTCATRAASVLALLQRPHGARNVHLVSRTFRMPQPRQGLRRAWAPEMTASPRATSLDRG